MLYTSEYSVNILLIWIEGAHDNVGDTEENPFPVCKIETYTKEVNTGTQL